MDWENYSDKVKPRIDRLGEKGDCDGLQERFETADLNDEAQRNRVGDGNGDLLAYIYAWQEHADCF